MKAILALSILLGAPHAMAAPISVTQSSDRNVLTIIQQRNPIITIDRSITASNGRSTVTEITRIGPDADPVIVRQSGSVNLLQAIQQGRNPYLDLQQTGAVNRAFVGQAMIP